MCGRIGCRHPVRGTDVLSLIAKSPIPQLMSCVPIPLSYLKPTWTNTHYSVGSIFHLQLSVYPLCLIRNKHFCMLHINHCLWFMDCFCMLKGDVCKLYPLLKYFLLCLFKADVCNFSTTSANKWRKKHDVFPKHSLCVMTVFK